MEKLPALQENQVEMLISQAIDKNVPVETMERILAMRKELKAEYAKEAFDADMAKFQAECPIIQKTKEVRSSQGLLYKYAPIESIVIQVKALLAKYNFSYSINTVTGEKYVTATCLAKHALGHSEGSNFSVPLGNRTNAMSDTQQVAAALTFAKRYAFCNAFGILTGDEDTDGRVTPPTPVPHEEIAALRSLLSLTHFTEEQVCRSMNITKLEELTLEKAQVVQEKLTKFIERQESRKND